jgi:hypothetical protein
LSSSGLKTPDSVCSNEKRDFDIIWSLTVRSYRIFVK